MVSDRYKFTESSPESARVPLRIEEYGRFCGLSATNARILSLLSEEMIGMVKAILPDFSAELWAENNSNSFELTVSVDAVIKTKERDDFLKASGGKNSAYGGGLLGKIGDLFVNWAIELNDNPAPILSYSDMELSMGMGIVNGYQEWSMRTYLNSMEDQKKPEIPDDGLERSIIVNLADDCKMSVKAGSVVMIVSKSFEEKGFSIKI
jgi:hypothetical protein